ncbi:MAG: methylated-DNA--[protein]-cysteine S-methyltransferase, partial [Patescibacteria group bacterium]
EYLYGKRTEFNLKYDLYITDFHKKVLEEMSKIKYGETKTYKELAIAVGRPNASRAVGAACRTNPIAIFIPCHRVVGSNGKLTGYAGGLPTKEWLLSLESSLA